MFDGCDQKAHLGAVAGIEGALGDIRSGCDIIHARPLGAFLDKLQEGDFEDVHAQARCNFLRRPSAPRIARRKNSP